MTVTLVIGAAASGKSAYAESLCLGHDCPRVYLATMVTESGLTISVRTSMG